MESRVKDAGLRELEITDWPDAVRTVIYRHKSPKVDIGDTKVDIGGGKVDIESAKADIDGSKVDIGCPKTDIGWRFSGLTGKTRKHLETVIAHASERPYFKRSDIINWTGLSHAAASKLLEKLLRQSIIVPVVGHGKGAYKLN